MLSQFVRRVLVSPLPRRTRLMKSAFSSSASSIPPPSPGDDDDDVAVVEPDDADMEDLVAQPPQRSVTSGPSLPVSTWSRRGSNRHSWAAELEAATAGHRENVRRNQQWDNEVEAAGSSRLHTWVPTDTAWMSSYDAPLDPGSTIDLERGGVDDGDEGDGDGDRPPAGDYSFDSLDELPWAPSKDAHAVRSAVKPFTPVSPVTRSVRVSAQGVAQATGRRKNAVARVYVRRAPGSAATELEPEPATSAAGVPLPLAPLGQRTAGPTAFVVNGRALPDYFPQFGSRDLCLQPLVATETLGAFEVRAVVRGGGYQGQAGAVRHALARALQNWDPEWRRVLKHAGFLRRDPRMVERKKTGQPKARKKNQWSKR